MSSVYYACLNALLLDFMPFTWINIIIIIIIIIIIGLALISLFSKTVFNGK